MTVQTAILIETCWLRLGAEVRWASHTHSPPRSRSSSYCWSRYSVLAVKGETYRWILGIPIELCNGTMVEPEYDLDDECDATMLSHVRCKSRKRSIGLGNPINLRMFRQFHQKAFANKQWLVPKALANIQGVMKKQLPVFIVCMQIASRWFTIHTINVNDSVTKSKFDNYMDVVSLWLTAIKLYTQIIVIASKVAGRFNGYGDVGKSCAQSLRSLGATVLITEIDPIWLYKQQWKDFKVMTLDEVLWSSWYFYGISDRKLQHPFMTMAKNADQAIVCNIGHFDNRNWCCKFGKEKCQWDQIKPQVDHYDFDDGKNHLYWRKVA